METAKRQKILWIDDDFRILKAFLRKVADEGVQVDYASNALEGYKKIKGQGENFDLILVDIILPLLPMYEGIFEIPSEIKGWEFADDLGILLIREIMQIKPTPIIAVLSILDERTVQKKLGELKVIKIFPKQTITSMELKESIVRLLQV